MGKWYTKLAQAMQELTAGTVDYTHIKEDVADSSTKVLDPNSDRKYALFINYSDEDIYMKIGGPAALVGRGIMLKAEGGSYEMSPRIGNLSTGVVRAIHDGAGAKTLLITEGE